MPWPRQHKTQTRERILAAAAGALREHGPEAVSVADVMQRAGLTHGGFYAHFDSKADLLACALERASEESLRPLGDAARAAPEERRLQAAVDAYLSPWHLTHVAAGCPVAALAPDVARAGGRLRHGMARAIRERIEWIRTLLPRTLGANRRRDDAVGTLACMVGGLVLARAVGGDDARDILAATRRFIGRAAGEPATD